MLSSELLKIPINKVVLASGEPCEIFVGEPIETVIIRRYKWAGVIKKVIRLEERLGQLERGKDSEATQIPQVDFTSWFYRNCKRQRKNEAKICQVCPFRVHIERQEALGGE